MMFQSYLKVFKSYYKVLESSIQVLEAFIQVLQVLKVQEPSSNLIIFTSCKKTNLSFFLHKG